jgi:hypothetical protein
MHFIARCRKICEWPLRIILRENDFFDYAGIGIAMLTLIETTVRVTIRQSDREPIASEAATASVSRGTTGAERPTKPAAPADRIMVQILQGAGESSPRKEFLGSNRRQYWGGPSWKTAK